MKKDILIQLSDENNGYLFTAEVLNHKISKTYLSKFVKENGYERDEGLLNLWELYKKDNFYRRRQNIIIL